MIIPMVVIKNSIVFFNNKNVCCRAAHQFYTSICLKDYYVGSHHCPHLNENLLSFTSMESPLTVFDNWVISVTVPCTKNCGKENAVIII